MSTLPNPVSFKRCWAAAPTASALTALLELCPADRAARQKVVHLAINDWYIVGRKLTVLKRCWAAAHRADLPATPRQLCPYDRASSAMERVSEGTRKRISRVISVRQHFMATRMGQNRLHTRLGCVDYCHLR